MEPNFEPARPNTWQREPKADPATAKKSPTGIDSPKKDPLAIDFADLDKITEDSLGFSALTDGLGFHPREKKIGTLRPSNSFDEDDFPEGIFSSDRVIPNPQQNPKNAANANAGVAEPVPAYIPEPVYKAAFEDEKIAVTHAETEKAPLESTANATPKERGLAFATDLAIVFFPLGFAILWNLGIEPEFLQQHWRSIALFLSVVFAFYLLIGESLGGQTLGKMLFHLVVVEDDKYRKPIGFSSAAKRLAFLLLGLIPAGIGSLAAIWDSKSRTWHDKLTASAVERNFEK